MIHFVSVYKSNLGVADLTDNGVVESIRLIIGAGLELGF